MGKCDSCDAPRVVDAAHRTCTQCSAGKGPMTNRSGCEDCTGTTYSRDGISCVACDSPNVVNDRHSSCSACKAGEGPNSERNQCVACTGTTFSTLVSMRRSLYLCGSGQSYYIARVTCQRDTEQWRLCREYATAAMHRE
jgi:hypothetical protein